VTDIVRARVQEHLGRLRLGHVAEQLDALLSNAARTEPTYLDFLDVILREEVGAKQRKRAGKEGVSFSGARGSKVPVA
jgi:hypothetical protein